MEKNLKQKQSAVIKIALFGPESTGKTTLAKQLAAHYKTAWIPEFARDYLQQKWDRDQKICDVDDMLPIAKGQVKLENERLAVANKYLFCDTNILVTKVYSEVYYNFCEPILDAAAKEHEYDLFFLTDIDVPWEKDDLRDKAEGRETVFKIFKKSLVDNKKPFIKLTGNKELRLKMAIAILEDLSIAKSSGFSSTDFVQIYNHGIAIANIQKQLEFLKTGISKTVLISPASIDNGILKLSDADLKDKADLFISKKQSFSLLKFVPASGAATRMFKFLITFIEEYKLGTESINAYINRKKDSDLSLFIIAMNKFPFFELIDQKLRTELVDFDSLENDCKNYYFIKELLSSTEFNYANKPKAILPFHKYKNTIATPVQEHLYECAYYGTSNDKSQLHFTISEEHQSQFEEIVGLVKNDVQEKFNTNINVSYSYQNKSTDSIAVDLNNEVLRDRNGTLVFRPGGHGSLIQNLNDLDADIIFVKNIDNVIHNHSDRIALYKNALAGILLELQEQIFTYLHLIESKELTEKESDEICSFMNLKLNIKVALSSLPLSEKLQYLKTTLNRPIRVCGMVKNEGEPGGGPFWVLDKNGTVSLQIVESSQVDLNNKDQKNILNASTHFNPVDLVCGVKNYQNEKFNLVQFVDTNSGFIVEKNIFGKNIKSYELPGLWNGAMANWITIFVEVPLVTFNPVKTVNDLLKPGHQISK